MSNDAWDNDDWLPMCRTCSYVLRGIGRAGVCPECGTAFDLADETNFDQRPKFVRWRFWLPGLIAATAGGAFFATLTASNGNKDFDEVAGVFAAGVGGILLGYRVRMGLRFFSIYLAIAAGFGISHGWIEKDRFRSIILAIVFYVIIGSGWIFICGVGMVVRRLTKISGYSQASYLP